MLPKARFQMLQSQVEEEMQKRKEKDHHWEDAIDVSPLGELWTINHFAHIVYQNPYQPTPSSYSSRLFRVIAAQRAASGSSASTESQDEKPEPQYRAARLRVGRGGRLLLDRRVLNGRSIQSSSEESSSDLDTEEIERRRRLMEQWRFDEDDTPAVGPQGPDEQDRLLVDDFKPP